MEWTTWKRNYFTTRARSIFSHWTLYSLHAISWRFVQYRCFYIICWLPLSSQVKTFYVQFRFSQVIYNIYYIFTTKIPILKAFLNTIIKTINQCRASFDSKTKISSGFFSSTLWDGLSVGFLLWITIIFFLFFLGVHLIVILDLRSLVRFRFMLRHI